jgi:hypothetical protein
LLAAGQLPNVIQCYERSVGLVLLPRIDGVSVIAGTRVGGIRSEDRDKRRKIRKSVVADSKQSEPVPAHLKQFLAIEFVLLPVFQAVKKPVPA